MKPDSLLKIHWGLVVHAILESLSDVIVRGILAHRVWKCEYNGDGIHKRLTALTTVSRGNVIIVAAIGSAAFLTFVGGMGEYLDGCSSHLADSPQFLSSIHSQIVKVTIFCALTMAAVTDIITSATLCYYLRRQRSCFQKTQSFVDTLVISTINAGILACVSALACLITVRIVAASYVAMPNKFIYLGIYYTFSKLLLNSMLATMNARPSTRDSNMNGSYMGQFPPNTRSSETRVSPSVYICGKEQFNLSQVIEQDIESLVSTGAQVRK
ncbi:hypothetical protein NLI96_g5723 [Meripilus lineatus]|uniref:DUF6534 domain-containing protein n=1 Tax=Meripilus lineatus TaxID=2056292 RepID=A0AAD5V2D0_9APHY|nr:hypothetical protein NLI96_g5723 [Physisporinus lineatus]